jgi:hypothetical protein
LGDRLDSRGDVQGVTQIAAVVVDDNRTLVDTHTETETLELWDEGVLRSEGVRHRNGRSDSWLAFVEDRHEIVPNEVHQRAASSGYLLGNYCSGSTQCLRRVLGIVGEKSAVADDVSVQSNENICRDGGPPLVR